ncbi:MAG: hypothetical protein NXH75_13420 [Halobacteriovoraceae bacterium]|nr:hypothetical protein [Halobacteriovoraceae bacterium]
MGKAIMLFMRKPLLVFLLLIVSVFAEKPLFNHQEEKELTYLSSKESIAHKQQLKLGKLAEAKMKVALDFYVRQDKAKRAHFFRPGLWEREEKRENYLAMKRWLQMVSPITKEIKKD